jgi:hypothetical protein
MYESSNAAAQNYNNIHSEAENMSESSDKPNRQARVSSPNQANYNYVAIYSNLTNSQNDTKL